MSIGSARSQPEFFVRLGLALSVRGPWARLRFAALCAGTVVLCLGLSGLAGTLALGHDRAMRAAAIRPTLTDDPDQATLLISFEGFTEIDDGSILVQSIWPLVPDAPLPPGVSSWPDPGEAVLSPAVRDILADSDPEFFGAIAGVIGTVGLETPTERRVYLRPQADILDQDRMHPATGFGDHTGDGWYGLGVLNAAPSWGVILMFLSATIVPGAAAIALGAGLDRQRRLSRHRQLTIAGARRRDRSLIDAGEAILAVVLGVGIAGVLVALVAAFGLRVPALDTIVLGSEVRRHLVLLAGMLVLGVVVAMLITLFVRPRMQVRPWLRRRITVITGEGKTPTVRAVAGLLIGAGTVLLPQLSSFGPLRTVIYGVGAVLFLLCLPALLAVILGMIGDAVARIAIWTGSVGGMLGGRRLGVFPGRTARLCLGIAGTVLIVGQVQLWSTQLGRQYFDAVALREEYGTSLLTAPVQRITSGVETFVATLDQSTMVMWSWIEEGSDGQPQQVLGATCDMWRALDLPCEIEALGPGQFTVGPPMLSLLASSMADGSTVAVRTLSSDGRPRPDNADSFELILMSSDGGDLQQRDLERPSYALVQGGLRLQTPWQSWLISGANTRMQGQWVVAWGLLGVTGMLLATALSLVGDAIASSRDIAPLAALSGRRRWLVTLSWWRLGLPITAAAVVGAVSYYILPSGLQTGENVMVASRAFVLTCVTAGAVTALLMTALTGRFLDRAAQRWRPGDSDYTTI